MENPTIEYIQPTASAFERMSTILFRPFDVAKWFILGFTAWLASFLDGDGGMSFNYSYDSSGGGGAGNWEEMVDKVRIFLTDNLYWIIPVSVFSKLSHWSF